MLVMQREYLSIVAKKSFIISTLLAPVIMLALVAIPALLMTVNNSDSRLISIIDETGQYSDIFKDNDDYRFRIETDMTPENMKDRYKKADGDIYAIVVIPSDVEESKTINVYSEKPVKITLSRELEEPLNKSLSDAKIASYNLPELKDMIAQSDVEVKIRSHTWDEEGEKVSSSEIAMIVGLFLAFLTYMFVLMYGAMIMGSVVEDKTNRIVEVIVSTCRPMELMLGKIVSIALVGLTQILIWAVFLGIGLFVVSMFGIATSTRHCRRHDCRHLYAGNADIGSVRHIAGCTRHKLVQTARYIYIVFHRRLSAICGTVCRFRLGCGPTERCQSVHHAYNDDYHTRPCHRAGMHGKSRRNTRSDSFTRTVHITHSHDDTSALRCTGMANIDKSLAALRHSFALCIPCIENLSYRHTYVWTQGVV